SFIRLYGGHDPGVCCRYYLGLAQWLLGSPDQALATVHDAVRLAESLKHPLSTVIALWFVAVIQYERGERALAAQAAERAIALIDAHGFVAWRNTLIPLLRHGRGDRPSLEELQALERHVVVAHATQWRRVLGVRVLATMYAEAGRPDEGLRLLSGQRGDAGFSA